MANVLLERAAHTKAREHQARRAGAPVHPDVQGFVYNQIWEDPDVDLEALALQPHHTLITIASGGCNVLNYLAADPRAHHRRRSQSQSRGADAAQACGARQSAQLRGFLPLLRQGQRQGQPHGLRQFPEHAARSRDAPLLGKADPAARPAHQHVRAQSLSATACSAASSASCTPWRSCTARSSNDIVEARTPAEQRARLRKDDRAAVRIQIDRLLSKRPCRFTRSAFRPRNMTSSWRRRPTAMRSPCCASASKSWPAISRSTKIISPGRPSRAATMSRTARRCRPICADTYDVIRTRTDRVEVHHASLTDFLKTQKPQFDPPLCAAGRAGLDDARRARRAVGADRPHGRHARCARDFPHRGRGLAAAAQAAGRLCWRPGNIRKRKAGPSTPRTARRSMAASTSMAAGPCPDGHDRTRPARMRR